MMHNARCSKEEVPYCFQGYLSHFKVPRDKKWPILTQIELFWTVTQVWIHRWIGNDAQILSSYRWDALSFLGHP